MKNYALDTNVLLHDPNAIYKFKGNRVIIFPVTIREIDKHKRDDGTLGRNSREVSRLIRGLLGTGQISDGVPLPDGGILQIPRLHPKVLKRAERIGASFEGADKIILEGALMVQHERKNEKTILVTKDTNMAIVGAVFGLTVQEYRADQVESVDVGGVTFELSVEPKAFDDFIADRTLGLNGEQLKINQYGILSCQYGEKSKPSTALVRVDQTRSNIVPIIEVPREGILGIRPRNTQQAFLFDALMRPDIHLVTIIGIAGTGKTLVTMAAMISQVESQRYGQIVVARPTVSMGKEIGFLPGSLDEKLAPWMVPIDDAISLIERLSKGRKNVVKRSRIEFQSLGHIRGRSIDDAVLIVDEAQNLTPIEVKGFVTRASSGTKVILTGDPYQIDVPYMDSISNGLVYTERKFSGEAIAAQVRLVKGERSTLAALAAKLL